MKNPIKLSAPEIYSHTALRGIAATYVVLFHLGWGDEKHEQDNAFFQFFHFGGYPVDLFFILSGFILNWVYLSKMTRIDWAGYFRARAARILPLYFLTTFSFLPVPVYSLFKHGLLYVGQGYPMVLILNMLVISGIVGGVMPTINGPAWSVSVEYFCYLTVFPLLYFAGKIYEKTVKGYVPLVVIVCFLTITCVRFYQLAPINIFGYTWDATWLGRGVFGFSTGFLLCSIYQKAPVHNISIWAINSVMVACIAIFIFVLLGFFPSRLLLFALPPLVFFSATDRGAAASLFRTRPFQWLGERSYSIYLWHVPVMVYSFYHLRPYMPQLLNDIFYCLLVLAVAAVSYRFFERPCREYIRKSFLRQNTFP